MLLQERGEYNVYVSCKNRLNTLQSHSIATIHVPLNAFQITCKRTPAEINETLNFRIIGVQNEAMPLFTIDYGDGTNSHKTKDLSFTHKYSDFGSYTVTVTAWNPSSSTKEYTPIVIMKPVLKLKKLSVIVNPANYSDASVIEIRLSEGSDFQCIFSRMDPIPFLNSSILYPFYVKKSLNKTPFQNILVKFPYTFESIGTHRLRVNCFNRKNNLHARTSVIIQIPIAGFQLDKVKPQKVGDSIKISWLTKSGSHIKFHPNWNKINVPYKTTGRRNWVDITEDQYNGEGLAEFDLVSANKVSGPLQKKIIVIIEDEIRDLSLNTDHDTMEVNETVVAKASMLTGSNPLFEFAKGDGSKPITTRVNSITYSYIFHGEYVIKVRAKNNVSEANAMVKLKVIKPVLPITRVTLEFPDANPISDNVTILFRIAQASDFSCILNFGDGVKQKLQLTKTNYYENGPVLNMNEFEDMTYAFSHKYAISDSYTVNIQCKNRLSLKIARKQIHMLVSIGRITANPVPPQTVGESFIVSFFAKGSNITYEINFLGKKYLSKSRGNRQQSIELVAAEVGVHTILMEASNSVSLPSINKLEVIVEVPIANLYITSPKINQSLEVKEKFSICYKMDKGSNPKFIISPRDAVTIKTELNCLSHSYKLLEYFTSGQAEMMLTISVIAYNNISKISAETNIILQKPVINLKASSLTCKVAQTNRPSYLQLVIAEGSDYECTWIVPFQNSQKKEKKEKLYYKNGNLNINDFSNILKTYEVIFKQNGNHIVEAHCKNRLSDFKIKTSCKVQDPIDGLKITALNRVIEVNDTIAVKASITSGTDPLFEFTKGDGSNPTITSDHSVNYAYILHGIYSIKVRARNNISEASTVYRITVIKPVLELTNIDIIFDKATKISENVTVLVKVEVGSDFKCQVNFGDGYTQTMNTVKTDYYENGPLVNVKDFENLTFNFSHKYDLPRSYHIQGKCSNRRSEKTVSKSLYMQLKIDSLAIQPVPPQKIGSSFIVRFVAFGTNITYAVLYLGKTSMIPSHDQSEKSFTLNANEIGIHAISIKASNLVTKPVQNEIKVITEEPISNLKITSPKQKTSFEVKEKFSICYEIEKGSNPHYKILTDDGVIRESLATCISHGYGLLKFFQSGESQRNMVISVHAYNNVSNISMTTNVILLKPVVLLKVSSLTCSIAETDTTTFLELSISEGSDFECTWIAESQDINVRKKREYLYYKNGSLAMSDYRNIMKEFEIIFNSPSNHIVKAYCENRLSNFTIKTSCLVQDFVEGLKVHTVKHTIEVNESIAVQATIKIGSDPLFEFEKGDGSVAITTKDDTVKYQYILHGVYPITVRASNNVSEAIVVHKITVIKPVLPITKVSLEFDKANRINDNVTIVIVVKKGSDFTCHVDFGDGGKQVMNRTNTNYYENGPVVDIKEFTNLRYNFSHYYKVAKVYTMSAHCSNRLSEKTVTKRINIQLAIGHLRINPVLPQKLGAFFNVTFIAPGSNITYEIQLMNNIRRVETADQTIKFVTLKASKTGVHVISIKASNLVTKPVFNQVEVIIETPVSDLQLTPPKNSTSLEVNETFLICTHASKGSNPKYIVVPEEGSTIKTTERCVSYSYGLLDYFKSGDANTKMTISSTAYNNVSSTTTSTIVMLQKPVIRLKVSSMSCLVAKTNETSVIKLLIDEGSDFECTWREELQGIRVSEEREYIYYKNGDLDMRNYKNIVKLFKANFHLAGSYLIHTNCRNRLSNFTMSTFCQVQDRIGDLIINDIKTQTIGLPSFISWKLVSGTNVTYTVYFNNIKLTPVDDRFTNAIIPTGMVTSPGHYKGSIIATNRITSNFTTTFEVIFERVLTEFNISITYVDENGKKRSGHGEKNSIFPSNTEVYFDLNKIVDHYNCIWSLNGEDIGGEEGNIRTELIKMFGTTGGKVIQYSANNNVSSVSGSKEFTIMQPVGKLQLTSDAPGAMNTPVKFVIYTPQKGDQSCFIFNAGDGTRYLFHTVDGDCGMFNESSGNYSGIFHGNTSEFIIDHIYLDYGEFTADIQGMNILSSSESSISVLISEVDCDYPEIRIENLGNTTFYPTRLVKSGKMTVYIDVKINCGHTSKTKYLWSIFKLNDGNNKRFPVKFNNKSYSFNPYIQKDLIIQKKVLDYGIYLIKVKLQMDSLKTRNFFAFARGYLHIYPSQLESIIEGGALLRRGWGKLLHFEGAKSYDPDADRGDLSGLFIILLYTHFWSF